MPGAQAVDTLFEELLFGFVVGRELGLESFEAIGASLEGFAEPAVQHAGEQAAQLCLGHEQLAATLGIIDGPNRSELAQKTKSLAR